MSALGDYLESHRKAAGVSLAEVADHTRISVAQLQALENERFELLPGGIFNVSFVRQYSRCIGADEEQAVSLLRQATAFPSMGAVELERLGRRDEFLTGGPIGRIAETIGNAFSRHGGTFASVTVGLLLLIGGVYS